MYELIEKYPKDLGFFMPAEWQSHQQKQHLNLIV